MEKQSHHTLEIESPFGPLTLIQEADSLCAIEWGRSADAADSDLLRETERQLHAYFAGVLTKFDIPLKLGGGAFQQQVCDAMLAIPYGATTTYGAIAKQLDTFGQPVGYACGSNTIPIIIPCHRVLAADGIGGYSGDGGVERKIELLKHEGGYPFLI